MNEPTEAASLVLLIQRLNCHIANIAARSVERRKGPRTGVRVVNAGTGRYTFETAIAVNGV